MGAARSGRYTLRKIVVGGIAAAMGATVGLAPWASASNPNSNGAQKAGLHVQTQDGSGNCQSGGAGSVGWAIVNGPGQPGAIKFINGEIHLVDPSAPNQTFDIWLGTSSGGNNACTMTMDTLTTNAQGIGNGHLSNVPGMAGDHFVALYQGATQKYASDQVPIN